LTNASLFVDTSPQREPEPPRAKRLPLALSSEARRLTRYLSTVDPAGDVFAAIACRSGLVRADLVRKDRHKRVALFRHVAAWLMREAFGLSFPELGREFGNRDHTTMMNSVRNVDAWRLAQPRGCPVDVRALTDALLADLGVLPAGPQATAELPAIPDLMAAQEGVEAT